ncbi:MAG: nucleoside deaminase [Reyranella sp.]|nr:nucleoside deaminase [Reyranella sp.]
MSVRHRGKPKKGLSLEPFEAAYRQAKRGYSEKGIPIGAVLVDGGRIVARGRNRRVQEDNAIAHGEMDCLLRAGRRKSYRSTTLFTTLSPCMMCAGTIVQFKIPRVVIGEAKTFPGNIRFLRSRGVEVTLLNDPRCVELMKKFQKEFPKTWKEDIGEDG